METGKSVDTSNDVGLMTAATNSVFTQDDSPANELNSGQETTAEAKPGEILKNLQNVSYVYRQDVVRSNITSKIGFVTEVSGDSDSDGSLTDDDDDDDEDDEDDEDNEEEGDSKEVGDDEAQVNNDEKVDGTIDVDGHKSHHLPADQIRVLWIDESETTESVNDVKVLDRGFLHGDYVAAATDPTGQVGVVVDVNMSVDLLTHHGSIIEGVNAKDLLRVRDFTVGDYVVLGPWLGRIDDVLDNVTVLFDDGSVCKVMKADPLRLKPVGKNILEDGHFPFYPGQRVRATSSSVFKNSRWLSGLWKANRLEGTVTKVTVGSVFIYWIASAGYGPDFSTTPAEEQNPKNLKLLSCFSHANWQLGDWCLLPSSMLSACIPTDKGVSKSELSDSAKEESEHAQTGTESSEVFNSEESNENGESIEIDAEDSLDENSENVENKAPAESSLCTSSLSISKESLHESWPLHRKKIRKVVVRRDKRARKKEENFERALLIVNTRTTVDVAWQDGTIGHAMTSTSLIPIENPGDHEFVAEEYVIEKAADDVDNPSECRRVGVVRNVNAKEKTAHVRWLKAVKRAEDPREFDKEEVVSVYELEGHPDYDYCYGDVVIRLLPVSVSAEIAPVLHEPELLHGTNDVKKDVEKQTGHGNAKVTWTAEASTEFSDLSWVGNITGLRNGDIEVTWADGMVSMVGPQAIYVVGRDDDESMGGGSEISDDAASWETVEDDEMETLENAAKEVATQSATDISLENEDGSENSGRNGALAIPLAALGFVTRLASGIFYRGRKTTDPDAGSEGDFQPLEFAGEKVPDTESCSQKSNGGDSVGSLSNKVETGEQGGNEAAELLGLAEALCSLKPDANATQRDDEASSFKGFDISKDPYDHYFLNANKQNNADRKWLRKVQQDWNILRNNLPDGIYVRVYEDRMDLLRAVIVGAYGTPYQDGLFFFDFHLPPEYPDVPPSAYYHSGGWRINPNLYEEGKVCLSLLNTWTGRGNEVWDPSSSSILQVLVSLQGLVLNSKPYFNEAGYDKQVGTAEGEKNSLSYNENTFLLNCKTMMYLIRKPPKDFEDLVREHFRRRGYYILKACDTYMKGYLIGSLAKDASISSNSDATSNSIGFKLMLAKLVAKLYSSLSDIGANCEEFKHLQQL